MKKTMRADTIIPDGLDKNVQILPNPDPYPFRFRTIEDGTEFLRLMRSGSIPPIELTILPFITKDEKTVPNPEYSSAPFEIAPAVISRWDNKIISTFYEDLFPPPM